MNYVTALKNAIDSAEPSAIRDREVIERNIAQINDLLQGPLPNFERICLAAERSELRKALAALNQDVQERTKKR